MTDLKDTLTALNGADLLAELGLLYNHKDDDSSQFTRWQMLVAIQHGMSLAARSGQLVPVPSAGTLEKHVMVCPQCDGEGGYPDGVDEAACHTDCTRCGGNGWIVDTTAVIAGMTISGDGKP